MTCVSRDSETWNGKRAWMGGWCLACSSSSVQEAEEPGFKWATDAGHPGWDLWNATAKENR